MGSKTGIEWTDSTWSPLRVRVRQDAAQIARDKGYTSLVQIAEKMAGHVGPHCEHVSPGCENCYAETNNHRCLPANGTGLPYDRRSRDLIDAFVDEKALLLPLKWGPVLTGIMHGEGDLRIKELSGGFREISRTRPRRIFVENQSDIFGDWFTDEMLDRIFAVMALCQQHQFQVLTKRPERMLAYFGGGFPHPGSDRVIAIRVATAPLQSLAGYPRDAIHFPLPNVWLGVSVENQATADERIPLLLQTAAAVRFISAEPLLGPVTLSPPADRTYQLLSNWYAPNGSFDKTGSQPTKTHMEGFVAKLDWVIVGGESGAGGNTRSMKPSWARTLRDQCQAANIRFFFKQWGEWIPTEDPKVAAQRGIPLGECMSYVGKKAAGALLDGREWREFPEVRHA